MVKGSDHCHALFVADTVPALLALGATVTIADAAGEEQIPLEDFYTGKGEQVNFLRPGQLLTRVQIAAPPPHSAGVYLRYSLREAIDFAAAGVAALLTMDPEDGRCRDARIVLGSVGSGPVRAVGAEAALRGRAIAEELVGKAARTAAQAAHPVGHLGVSAGYKRRVIEVLTKRAVREAWQRAVAGPQAAAAGRD